MDLEIRNYLENYIRELTQVELNNYRTYSVDERYGDTYASVGFEYSDKDILLAEEEARSIVEREFLTDKELFVLEHFGEDADVEQVQEVLGNIL